MKLGPAGSVEGERGMSTFSPVHMSGAELRPGDTIEVWGPRTICTIKTLKPYTGRLVNLFKHGVRTALFGSRDCFQACTIPNDARFLVVDRAPEPTTIIVLPRDQIAGHEHEWCASVSDHPEINTIGNSREEAVGKLVLANPKLFPIGAF